MYTLRAATSSDCGRAFSIWKSAVIATHHFISREDFATIEKMVEDEFLPNADLTVAVDLHNWPHGFIAARNHHIDALFVHADSHGKGIGKMLLRNFLTGLDVASVDVNEQNQPALDFYQRQGFAVTGRSEVDNAGRPYPLLHLAWHRDAPPQIRRYQPDDLDCVIEVFLRAIRETASRDYTADQVEAWTRIDRDVWSAKRLSRPTWVAECDRQVAGFIDLEPDGHLDMMYVHPKHSRRGVASLLLRAVEVHARSVDIIRLFSEVSLTARPFFERQGFDIVEPERVYRNGQYFDRFKMIKDLRDEH